MKRLFLIVLITSFALPATALGKGPSAASIDGPGGGGGITFTGYGESAGSSLGDLTLLAGFFPAPFREEPRPIPPSPQKGPSARDTRSPTRCPPAPGSRTGSARIYIPTPLAGPGITLEQVRRASG